MLTKILIQNSTPIQNFIKSLSRILYGNKILYKKKKNLGGLSFGPKWSQTQPTRLCRHQWSCEAYKHLEN